MGGAGEVSGGNGRWGQAGQAGQEEQEEQVRRSVEQRGGDGASRFTLHLERREAGVGGQGEGGGEREGGMLDWPVYKTMFYVRAIYKPIYKFHIKGKRGAHSFCGTNPNCGSFV